MAGFTRHGQSIAKRATGFFALGKLFIVAGENLHVCKRIKLTQLIQRIQDHSRPS
jgi:hypothetical protein